MTTTKRCWVCKEFKELDAFYNNRSKPTGKTDECKPCVKVKVKEYRAARPEWMKKQRKSYKKRRAHVINARERTLRKTNENFRLKQLLRGRLYKAMQGGFKSGSAVGNLGCSIDDLRVYLESKFLPGMSWDNAGDWHIDHIRPLASFDLTDAEQLRQACHYTNLQPLWAVDNLSKGAKYVA